jgi:protein TonB
MLALSHPSAFAAPAHGSRQTRTLTVAIVVGLHVAVVYALLQIDSVREQLAEIAPIMVSLITPPQVKVAPPVPEPQKTKPVEPRRPKAVESPPVITAPVTASSAVEAPAPQPEVVKPREAPAPAAPEPAPVSPPRFDAAYLQNPSPPYPALSRRMSEEGRVMLRVRVGVNGEAEQVELRTSSGYARLDQSALDTVKKWKFTPARQNGQPVAASVLVPISFRLER